jgi:uncharacterized membrane protein HdeD (DUF308 family)
MTWAIASMAMTFIVIGIFMEYAGFLSIQEHQLQHTWIYIIGGVASIVCGVLFTRYAVKDRFF